MESCEEVNYNDHQICERVKGLLKIIAKGKKKSISFVSMYSATPLQRSVTVPAEKMFVIAGSLL